MSSYRDKLTEYQLRGEHEFEQVKRILEDVSNMEAETASLEDDRKHATDIILKDTLLEQEDNINVAVRIRQYKYFKPYGNQFVIRSEVTTNETELSKILKGYADWLFYGFYNEDETKIQEWAIIDLAQFRKQLPTIEIEHEAIEVNNNDGSKGKAYKYEWFDDALMIAFVWDGKIIKPTNRRIA